MSIPKEIMDRFSDLLQSCLYDQLIDSYRELRRLFPGRIVGVVVESTETAHAATSNYVLSIMNADNAAVMQTIEDEDGVLLCVFVDKGSHVWFISIALPEESFGYLSPGGNA